MTLKLIVASGAHEGEVIPIRQFPFLVGRTKGCQLHAASEFVSRRHCQISNQEDKYYVADLDSTNGTFLNGQAILQQQELSPGDRLLVGPLEFIVELETDAAAGAGQPHFRSERPEPAESQAEQGNHVKDQVNEEAIADFLLGQSGEDQEDSAEDTTEKDAVKHPSEQNVE
jgi:pSer/pThr/pTyr-binding forkhead associated (FHA) protein